MFILRIIEETRKDENSPFEQKIRNLELGNSYSIKKEKDNLTLLCGENGIRFFVQEPLPNSHYFYFIMTDNGQTFENISFKK